MSMRRSEGAKDVKQTGSLAWRWTIAWFWMECVFRQYVERRVEEVERKEEKGKVRYLYY